MNFGTIERGYENRAQRDWEDACEAAQQYSNNAAALIAQADAATLGGYIYEHGDSKLIDELFVALRDCREPMPTAIKMAFDYLMANVEDCIAADSQAEDERAYRLGWGAE